MCGVRLWPSASWCFSQRLRASISGPLGVRSPSSHAHILAGFVLRRRQRVLSQLGRTCDRRQRFGDSSAKEFPSCTSPRHWRGRGADLGHHVLGPRSAWRVVRKGVSIAYCSLIRTCGGPATMPPAIVGATSHLRSVEPSPEHVPARAEVVSRHR
jgi:hypothetical protein